MRPVEQAGPALAQRLDKQLCGDTSWQRNPSHLRLSVRLVEETYLAIAALAGDDVSGRLRDGWATARHVELLQAVASPRGLLESLSRGDRGRLLRKESEARRNTRTGWSGLSEERLAQAFRFLRPHIPTVGAGCVTIVVGPLGSGKSELCEEWFRDAVDRYIADGSAPVPVWMHASELSGVALETLLAERVPPGESTEPGVALVIDGLDEVDAVVASRVVAQARALAYVRDKSSALLATRPGVVTDIPGLLNWEGLEHDEAVRLVETVAGSSRTVWAWNASLVDAIRRPFFAIAAGLLLADGHSPTGQAELIDRLVRRALERASSASASLQSSDDFGLLVRVAIAHARHGSEGDGLTFPERQRVLRSTLTHARPDGSVEFSLPIFQQWFAADAILRSPEIVAEAFASPSAFDSWRWALAVAGIAADPQQLDDLLERSIRANPGAGAWLLDRIADGHRSFREQGSDVIDPIGAPQRLLRATRTWIDATGELATKAYPIRDTESFTLGVRVSGNRVDVGWLIEESTQDRVLPLPDDVHPFVHNTGPWWPDRAGAIAEANEWPWILSQARIKREVLPLLNREPSLGPAAGVWCRESRYRALRRLTRSESFLFPPIPRDSALATVTNLLQHVGDPAHAVLQVGRGHIRGDMLVNLAAWLAELDDDVIERPVPVPDVDPSQARSSWIWDVYSEPRLQEFYATVLGLACVAYDELAETVFSKFAWSLGTRAEGEFGVIADLSFFSGWGGTHMPGIASAKVPIRLVEEARLHAGSTALIAPNGRALVTLSPTRTDGPSWVHDFVRAHTDGIRSSRATNPFSHFGSYSDSIADGTNSNRPASSFAARWVFDDLKALGLAEGTFPQLED